MTEEAGAGPVEVFRVGLEQRESRDALVLAGQINMDAAARLREEALFAVARGRPVDIDWREAQYLSASAIQVLLALGQALQAGGRTLAVAADNPAIRGTLEMAGLVRQFPLREAKE
jgi:anti-anti-sigma factor